MAYGNDHDIDIDVIDNDYDDIDIEDGEVAINNNIVT